MDSQTSRQGIGQRLTAGGEHLTQAERRVARALLMDYPAAGLDTVASLAERAKVSGPTVIRFAKTLGFDSFRSFQDALRDELGDREASALSQTPGYQRSDERAALLQGVGDTLASVPAHELEHAVELLSNPKRRVMAFGGDYSRVAADHLVLQLAPVRRDVTALPPATVLASAAINDVRKGDVWCVFDVRRYQTRARVIAEAAQRKGAEIVLFTDRWVSPVASTASVVLTAQVEGSGPTDSAVPLLALTEVVCERVERALGDDAFHRLSEVDPLRLRIDGAEHDAAGDEAVRGSRRGDGQSADD